MLFSSIFSHYSFGEHEKFHNRLVRQAPTNYAEKILQEVSEQRALAFNPSGTEHYQMRTKPIFSHLKL